MCHSEIKMPLKETKKKLSFVILSVILTAQSSITFFVQYLLMCVYVSYLFNSQGAAAYPENEDQQQRLREAAEGLRVATNAAAQNAIKKKLINRLEVSDPRGERLHHRDALSS